MAVTAGPVETRSDLGGEILPELTERFPDEVVCTCLESTHDVFVFFGMTAHHDDRQQMHVVVTAARVFLPQFTQKCHAGLDTRPN